MVSVTLSLLVALVGQSAAHFLVLYPPGIGFDDENEGDAPCGSFTVDFTKDNLTDWHVGGDVIALQAGHPQITYSIRGTLDDPTTGNWTQLFPFVQQTGLGAFCEPIVTAPESWAGQKGVISVVADAPDGLLYQCMTVNFVTGTGAGTTQSECKNATGVTAAIQAQDTLLSNLPNSPASSGSASSPTSSGPASSTGSGTAKPSAANSVTAYSGLGMLAWIVVVGGATGVAFLL